MWLRSPEREQVESEPALSAGLRPRRTADGRSPGFGMLVVISQSVSGFGASHRCFCINGQGKHRWLAPKPLTDVATAVSFDLNFMVAPERQLPASVYRAAALQ